jgi:archaellum biogenesis ATPase FlaH
MVNGREGTGKTTICMQAGKEILQTHENGTVLWLATEGAVQDTVNKMESLGLTDQRFMVGQKSDGTFKFDSYRDSDRKELDTLLNIIEKPLLAVFIDSIRGMSRLDDNDPKNGDIMHALNAIVCDKYNAGLIYIDHHGKGHKSNLLDKSVGTTAKTSAVRVVLSITAVSNLKRLVEVAKCNIFSNMPNLQAVKAGNEIFISQPQSDNEETIAGKIEDFLVKQFSERSEIPSGEIYRKAKEAGFSEALLKRVKQKLDIKSARQGYGEGGTWMWIWDLYAQ